MKQTRGVYSRSRSPYIELEAKRSDSYLAFARKAAKICRLADEPELDLCLFKLNGARILNEPVTVRGRNTSTVRPWTLGNYLLLMKKSPSHCKIGVAYAQPLHISSGDSVSISFIPDLIMLLHIQVIRQLQLNHNIYCTCMCVWPRAYRATIRRREGM